MPYTYNNINTGNWILKSCKRTSKSKE